MKTDCWRIAFPSSSPPPTPTVVAQFPGLLRDESPCVIIQVLISTSFTLNFSQQETLLVAYKSCWQCTGQQLEWVGSPVFRLPACSPPSHLAVRLCPPSLFPSISACGCFTCASSSPCCHLPQTWKWMEASWLGPGTAMSSLQIEFCSV